MFRRIQLSAVLAVGGFAVVSLLSVACSDRPGASSPSAGGPFGPSVARADEPKAPASVSKHQNYSETLDGPEGKVSFDMVAVPGGEFEFGSSKAEEERKEDEGPQDKVRLKPFWIGKCEVTWDEFDLYFRYGNKNLEKKEGEGEATEEKKSDEPDDKTTATKDDKAATPADAVSKPTRPYVDETYGYEREKNPAICMTHHAALKYCEWLSKKTGKDYRLPTEAEWEYACRAGTTGAFGIPTGAKLEDYAWFKANSRDMSGRLAPHSVGTKKPNAWGIHDMHGNVMEWCLDHYVKNAHALFAKQAGKDGFVLNPVFMPTENKWAHTARGGHFKDEPKDLRSAARRKSEKKWMSADPQEPQSIWWLTNYPIIGFRVVRPVEPDELTGITSKVVKENDEEFKP